MDHPWAAGAIAGLATCILLQPLDVIKTRLQEPRKGPGSGPWQAIHQISRQQGLPGFWRGLSPTFWRNVPGTAIYFVGLQQVRYLLLVGSQRWPGATRWLIDRAQPGKSPQPNALGHLVAGATARVLAGFMLMPLTVAKVRFESSQYAGTYRSLPEALLDIGRKEGLAGLFRGFGATALRDAPFAGLYIAVYEPLKAAYRTHQGAEGEEPFHAKLAAGLAAGVVATTITQPFDLVKSRIQLRPADYPNAWQAVQRIFRTEGPIALFNGLLPRALRKSFGSALTWAIYEQINKTRR